jgi:hypothetical protein
VGQKAASGRVGGYDEDLVLTAANLFSHSIDDATDEEKAGRVMAAAGSGLSSNYRVRGGSKGENRTE